ncbi:MAG: ATP synthase F1 subunit gamma [Bacilli bacterium]|nr:ATP synthase F1 subunit gamma [Bacilli bacterium]
MSLQLTNIKKRIKSVTGAYKVTSAMKLVSTVRLRKYKNKMLSNRAYIDELAFITEKVLSKAKKIVSPFYERNEEANKNLYIIISSTLGLCGSYNSNIFRLAEVEVKSEDDAIILGKKGLIYFKNGTFSKVDGFSDYSNYNDKKTIREIVNYVTKTYQEKEYREIHFIYTEYKNSIVFLAKDFTLLPLKKEEVVEDDEVVILEPTPGELIESLVPKYIDGMINAKLLESEVCEQAARCNAMDNATTNAEEILNTLKIEFNKARQASITQEITEIVGASNAL